MKEGILLLSHGSRRVEANQEIIDISELIRARDPRGEYQVAFMSNGSPDIGAGIEKLAAAGMERIIVMPLFLVTGNHITLDIPSELEIQKERWPAIQFRMAQHLAGHPGLVDIVLERIQACSAV